MRAIKPVGIGVAVIALAALLSVEQTSAQSGQGAPPPPPPTQGGGQGGGQGAPPTQGGGQGRTMTPPPAPPPSTSSIPSTPEDALRDIRQTLGFMPQWLRSAPDTLIVGLWASLKGFEMNPNTALDAKTKELIGLAVAAQIPCEYCVYFHTASARKNGATDQEIREAIGMASVTRMGSTILNGSQVDKVTFRKDTDRMFKGESMKTQARRMPSQGGQ